MNPQAWNPTPRHVFKDLAAILFIGVVLVTLYMGFRSMTNQATHEEPPAVEPEPKQPSPTVIIITEDTKVQVAHPITKFQYKQLAPHLQDAAKPFSDLADLVNTADMTNEEDRLKALNKLLEAKDLFLKSCLMVKFKKK